MVKKCKKKPKKLLVFLGVMLLSFVYADVQKDTIYSDKEMKVIVERIKPEPIIVEKIITKEIVIKNEEELNSCIADNKNKDKFISELVAENESLYNGLAKISSQVNKTKEITDKEVAKLKEGKAYTESNIENKCAREWYDNPYVGFIVGFIIGWRLF